MSKAATPILSFQRTAREIELTELKLQAETTKLGLEAVREQLVIDEIRRSERNEKAKASEARVYTLLGNVNDQSAKAAVDTLNEWARRDKKPITLVINSPGGSVFPGMALFDAIQELRCLKIHFTSVCRGTAASMAGVLLQAADERVIGENSYVLIHEVSDLEAGKTAELDDQLKLAKRLQERLLNILAERSVLSPKQIESKWKKTDWWLDSAECVKLGFADRIG